MKSKVLKITSVLLAAALGACLFACGNDESDGNKLYQYTSYGYFNYTEAKWVFTPAEGNAAGARDAEVWKEIVSVLSRVENSVSTDGEESSVAKFNAAKAGARVEIDETAYDLLVLAKEFYEKTDGAYNPALGNLLDLWGYSPRFSATYQPTYPYDRESPETELPDTQYVEQFLTLSDFSGVELLSENGKYYAVKPAAEVTLEGVTYNMQLNLGGIGKGYAVDLVNEIIREAGYEYGYFNLGGSSMCLLQLPSGEEIDGTKYWEIGVINPRPSLDLGGDIITVTEADVCLSSSGDYVQYYVLNGKRYSHIMNPATGYPVNAEPQNADGSGIVCASVFGLSAAEGDATTTALMVMGKEAAMEYLRNLDGVDGMFLYYDGALNEYTLYTNMAEGSYRVNASYVKVGTL